METKIKISKSKDDLDLLMKAVLIAKNNPDKTINKAIGAIIVKDGKIIGEGFRTTNILQKDPYKDITYHGEHMALKQAGNNAKGATLYTTLEPCTQRSKGPGWDAPDPCVKLIHDSGIKRVVIGIFDSDFGSGGAKYLLDKGIEVAKVEGIDENEFKEMVENPKILDEKARKLQEEIYKKLKQKNQSGNIY